MANLIYEQPTLKKYGTMKEFTHASAGSGGDSLGVANVGRSGNSNAASDRDIFLGNLFGNVANAGSDPDGNLPTSNANDSFAD